MVLPHSTCLSAITRADCASCHLALGYSASLWLSQIGSPPVYKPMSQTLHTGDVEPCCCLGQNDTRCSTCGAVGAAGGSSRTMKLSMLSPESAPFSAPLAAGLAPVRT